MTHPQLSPHTLIGTFTTLFAVITANQEHIEWGLRCGASGVAIIVGLCTIWSLFRPKKQSTPVSEKRNRGVDSVD